jgi:hypothetical protein
LTIIVTAKVTDGIVLAADSAATFSADGRPLKIYNNANKIFNLVKVWPIGALVYGSGGIGAASVETLTKDLRRRLSDPKDPEYGLNLESYTVEDVARKARKFLFEECYRQAHPEPMDSFFMGYRVCGYSANASASEVWEFQIVGGNCDQPTQVQSTQEFGLRWAGENEALDRLLLGTSGAILGFLIDSGYCTPETVHAAHSEIINRMGVSLIIPAMPIQDAIDVARFAVETSAKFARHGLRPETIGGPTELAAITKHEGFKWVSRKHYYDERLNRETNHGQ